MCGISTVLAGLISIQVIYAARVVYDMNITYVNDINPDGLYSRQVVGVNNQWPWVKIIWSIVITCVNKIDSIPALNVTRGDTLVMNVHNSLNEPTALHSHGQFQNGTNYMDGPVSVTQWYISVYNDK